jgi:hypothetical protein
MPHRLGHLLTVGVETGDAVRTGALLYFVGQRGVLAARAVPIR